MPPENNRWFEFAEEDLQMAELALQNSLYNQVCFHAQQAAEKLLKSVISDKGQLIPKTHKMVDLLSLMKDEDLAQFRDRLILLDRFYIPTRYPDALPGVLPNGLPVRKDAEEALGTACALRAKVSRT